MSNLSNLSFALLLVISLTEAAIGRLPYPNKFPNDAGTLIVGGRPARQGEAPYQLSLKVFGNHFCGASLIELNGTQFGVTAAHCIYTGLIPDYSVVAGDINTADDSGLEQLMGIQDVIKHQNFGGLTLENDIALIFFNGSFVLNENVQPIPLPSQGQVTAEGNLTVSGWGGLEYNGNFPTDLQIVEIPIVNDTFCQKAYENYSLPATDSMICTGVSSGGLGHCGGDSGGPGISDTGYLAGIVSWANDCGHPDYPSVFTEVSYFVDWIQATAANFKNYV